MDVPIPPPPTMTTSAVVTACSRVHRRPPLRMRARPVADGAEVRLADLGAQGPDGAVADGMPVDRQDRCDLRGGAGEEGLFADVELGAIHQPLLHVDAERFPEQREPRVPGDPLE